MNLETKNIFVDEVLQVSIAPPCVQRLDKCAEFGTNQTTSQKATSPIQCSDEFYDVLCGWILRKVRTFQIKFKGSYHVPCVVAITAIGILWKS